jgi:hypothetical protein
MAFSAISVTLLQSTLTSMMKFALYCSSYYFDKISIVDYTAHMEVTLQRANLKDKSSSVFLPTSRLSPQVSKHHLKIKNYESDIKKEKRCIFLIDGCK